MSEYAIAGYGILERSRVFASLDTSGSSSNGERDINSAEDFPLQDESDDDDDAFISFTTTESRCEHLYQRGLELKIQEELGDALLCFEDCLKGMQNCQYFAKLPQTLQQLQHIYKILGNEEKAEEYREAEKLFQEATEPKGSPRGRAKRKPFSKKTPSLLSVPSCNPAEYGNLLISRAEEYEKLARLSAEKGDVDAALEQCRKAAIMKQCVHGQDVPVTEASMTLLEYIYTDLEETKGRLAQNGTVSSVNNSRVNELSSAVYEPKGDLSLSPLIELHRPVERSGRNESKLNSFDRKIQSANCGQPHPDMWSTGGETSKQWPAEDCTELLMNGSTSTPLHRSSNVFDSTLDTKELCSEGSEDHSTSTVCHTDSPPTFQSSECNGNHILEHCGGLDRFPPQEQSPGQCWVIPVQPQNGNHSHHPHSHHHHKNLCKGVTKGVKNLTKLSAELKAPMCVTLDVQTVKPGTGMEHPRCLPLWVLLLGAFVEMVLLAYMLYNH